MTRYWFDTEFHERESGMIEFISIGIISDQGETFYAVGNWFDLEAAENNWWLKHNVLDRLDVAQENWLSRDEMKAALVRYFRSAPEVPIDRPQNELWAWFAAYDYVVMASVFGGMIKIPRDIPFHSLDVIQEWRRLGKPKLGHPANIRQHNALADAIECRDRHLALIDYDNRKNNILT